MKKTLFIFILFLLQLSAVRAEVFWLSPLGKGGTSKSSIPLAERLPGVENASPLLREPVKVNGKEFTLELFRSGASFDEMVKFLKKQGVGYAVSQDTLRCAVQLADGTVERLLIVRSPGSGPVTVFRIAGPPGVPQNAVWDSRLPALPAGTRALQVIHLPRRNSVYGIFDGNRTDPASAFRDIDLLLRSQGWQPAGNEGSPLAGGSGDIYYHRRGSRIMWVTCDSSGRGAFYCKN